MFLPSHLHTSSGSDQKVPAPTGSATLSTTLLIAIEEKQTHNRRWRWGTTIFTHRNREKTSLLKTVKSL